MKCPYCQYPGPHSLVGAMQLCAGCGETFPAETLSAPVNAAPTLADVIARHQVMRHKKGILSVRKTFIICIGVAVLSFAAGLVYRITQSKPVVEMADPSQPKLPYAPLKIPALRFLPKQLDGILAVQNRFLQQSPQVLENWAAISQKLKLPDDWAQSLLKNLDTDWANVLEMVVAINFEKQIIPPQLYIVLHTREEIDLDAVLLHPKSKLLTRDKRKLLQFTGPANIPMVAWQPVEKYLILTLNEADYDNLPLKAEADGSHLAPTIREAVQAFVLEDMLAWMVLDSEKLANKLGPLGKTLPPDVLAIIESLNGINAGLRTDGDPKIGMTLLTKQEATAAKWREWLIQTFADKEGKIQVGGGKFVFLRFDFEAEVIDILRKRLSP
jgi:hypothetical protein